MTCPICNSGFEPAFTATVLGSHEATYVYCNTCGFLCTRNPYWLEEAYSSAISSTDTGLVLRNLSTAAKIAAVIFFLFGERGNQRYLDIAGGYGMLTRLMRDYGFDFYWSDKYCQNLLARGFEYHTEMGKCRAVTAIEVLEHTEDPVTFVREALEQGQTDTLIFTTELFEGRPPPPDQWRYYALETGKHISFFQYKTLSALARHVGLNHATAGEIHIFSKYKINEFMLSKCTGRLGTLAARFLLPRLLGSRVMSDHDNLVKQCNQDSTGRRHP
jgi:Methyltransferase domain